VRRCIQKVHWDTKVWGLLKLNWTSRESWHAIKKGPLQIQFSKDRSGPVIGRVQEVVAKGIYNCLPSASSSLRSLTTLNMVGES